MSSLVNEHVHPVVDENSDGIFVIDPVSRKITLEVDGTPVYFGGPVIVKGDINSERLTFKIPKVIEGHDMSSCDTVRIHYITINPETSAQYPDVYDVLKKDITPDGNDYLRFSWLIDQYVTRYASPVSFVVQFACTRAVTVGEEQKLVYDYSWSTVPYTELNVSDGFTNNKSEDADAFVDQYNSIVTQWHNEIEEAIARADARTGPDGKSAYQVAVDNGFDGSEQEWVETLATSYVECLKGRTITQAEFDALSEEEQNREGYVYVIKDAEIHVDTADHATTADTATNAIHATTADTATNANHATTADTADSAEYAMAAQNAHHADDAVDYTEQGGIADAFNAIPNTYSKKTHSHTEFDEIAQAFESVYEFRDDHADRIQELENNASSGTADAAPIEAYSTRSNTLEIEYTTGAYNPATNKHTVNPQTVTYPPEGMPYRGEITYTNVEITSVTFSDSHTKDGEYIQATLSEDGKSYTISIGGVSTNRYQDTSCTAIISYKETSYGNPFHISSSEETEVNVSSNRTYLAIRRPYSSPDEYFETATIYIGDRTIGGYTQPSCLSTPFSDGSRIVIHRSGSWYAYGIDSSGNRTNINYLTLIEL